MSIKPLWQSVLLASALSTALSAGSAFAAEAGSITIAVGRAGYY